jgi:hypothetical protein
MKTWNQWPEWVRWVLLFPTLFVGSALTYLLLLFLMGFFGGGDVGWSWMWWWNNLYHRGIIPFAIIASLAGADYAMLAALAPRGHRILGWLFYVPASLLSLAAVVVLVIRFSGATGGGGLEADDWSDLSRSLSWIICGSYCFSEYLNRYPKSDPRTRIIPAKSESSVLAGLSTSIVDRDTGNRRR